MIKAGKKLHQKSRSKTPIKESKPQIGASKTILGYDRPPNEQITLKQLNNKLKKKDNKMKIQDLDLYEVKQAWEKVQDCRNNSVMNYDWKVKDRMPNIFFELAEKKKTLNTSESYIDRRVKYLKAKHSCTVEGIQALSKLAKQGDTGAMRV